MLGRSLFCKGRYASCTLFSSIRLEEAVRECQKTANVDLQKLITNSESCAQCLQHLVAMETNPTRVVSTVFSALISCANL